MKFNELIGKTPDTAFSFEVFPPKTDQAMDRLRDILRDLVELKPDFMTVTYGAMGTTRERTLEIAEYIMKEFKLATACHLTCVGSSRADLDNILVQIFDAGIQNIVALRGDPPMGQDNFVPPADGLAHANELVAHIRSFEERTGRKRCCIAVAGYPEKHLEAPNLEADLANLKRKVDAGADLVVTQLFFDNKDYFDFVDRARSIGITIPIVPGIMPILSAKQIQKISSMCGSKIPAHLRTQLEAVGEDDSKAQDIGVRQCIEQVRELIERGVPGVHFYVLNRSAHMKAIMEGLPGR